MKYLFLIRLFCKNACGGWVYSFFNNYNYEVVLIIILLAITSMDFNCTSAAIDRAAEHADALKEILVNKIPGA